MAVSGLMLGFAFAMVPLFKIVCVKLGLDGTTQRATVAPTEITNIPITVRFDSNVDKQLPWQFVPDQKSVDLKLGETATVFYKATNTSDHPTSGTASFNVTPEKIGQYFNKLACFCFTEQTLKPGESMEMGVTFFVDPAMVKDKLTDEVRTITLSYTFFPSQGFFPKDGQPTASNNADTTTQIKLTPVSGPAPVNTPVN